MKMNKIWLCFLFVLIVLAVCILPIGGRPMLTPDETRYAEIPREMLLSGNYISPRLNGVRYFEKPAFSYWAFAISFKIFGMNRFALRLPCMTAMLATAWIVYLLMGRFYRDPRIRLLGAMVFATMPFVYALSTIAITDMFLTLFVTGASAACFLAAQDDTGRGRRVLLLLLCGVCCGFAFLSKGFLAIAVPAVTLLPYLIWDRKWKKIFTLPWIPLAAMLLTVAPWCFAIHRQEPDFWHYFFFEEHINRFFGQEKAQHARSFFYFFPFLAAALAIWLLMIPNLWRAWRDQVKSSPLLKFCVCGVVLPFLLFSCSSGKLPTYILPCLPPAAILIAAGAEKFFVEERRDRAFHLTLLVLAVLLPLTLLFVTINLLTGFPAVLFMKEDWPQLLLIAAVSAMCMTVLFLSWKAADRYAKLFLLLIALLPPLFASNFVFPVRMKEWQAPNLFLAEVALELPKENTVLVTHRRPFQDVCWAFQTTDVRMFIKQNEISYGMSYPEEQYRFIPDFPALQELCRRQKAINGHVAVITPLSRLDDFEDAMPEPERIWKSYPGMRTGYAVLLY
ncbi:MAG: phospholipid carrier-dependent glycosyltransferase [Lentisphaeria bacterium]|nr:phospholipid carrier-dependent glycosyltransferase [Lentisphaeria bacterium]